MKKIYFIIFVFLFSILSGCSNDSIDQKSVRKSEVLMDTVVAVEIYGTDDEKLLDKCFETGMEYEDIFSKTIEGSETDKINKAGGNPVTVSEETVLLLKKAVYFGEESGGAFDITISRINDLWDFKSTSPEIPDKEKIQSLLYTTDYKKIQIEGNTVTLNEKEANIDLGGIAKGYIGDKMKEFLQEKGIKSAMINLGGDVVTIGSKPDGSAWNIGIQKPFDEMNEVIESVSVKDKSVISSGSYERYFEKDGQIYHHILDTTTGYPVRNELTSVTIITDSAADGDALSTACFALGLEAGMQLIEEIKDTEAIFITEDEEIHYSSSRSQ